MGAGISNEKCKNLDEIKEKEEKNEKSKDYRKTCIKGRSMQHRMRRMPDFMSVSMQDFMHSC